VRSHRFLQGIALTISLAAAACSAEAAQSSYTAIRPEACGEPPPAVREEFANRDLEVQECPAPDGWRLLFVSSNENSWLELRRGEAAWSAEEAVVYEQALGNFPSVAGSSVIEWRGDAGGRARALIFRVVAQDRDDPDRRVSRLFVVRLAPDGPCLIGRSTTNEEAHALADGPAACPKGSTNREDDPWIATGRTPPELAARSGSLKVVGIGKEGPWVEIDVA
jgi:hypothetical protein